MDHSNSKLDTTEEITSDLENKSIENKNYSNSFLKNQEHSVYINDKLVELSNTYVTVISGERIGNGE